MATPEPIDFTVGPLPYIRGLINAGVGPTEGLRQFREAGGAIRTQRWFGAFGELQAEAAVRPQVVTAPTNRPPIADEITQVSSAKPGAYLYRGGVIVTTRSVDPQTGATVESTQTNWAALRTASLIDYEAAMAELEARFGPEGQSGIEHSTVIGSFISAVNDLVAVQE
jgi:hypothetical protein